MHLKKLQLTGFKTFAERTTVEFSPGVTAIVGPNGSGKSNISDAILWVLGEQRASAIRGVKLQDVIFSGSSLRKPTGLAEVSLTVDNSDGSLPLAFDEVTITRRAYRSGEGEFFINKTPCRLKDIHELFLDTGVGRESYALVNQSEVDAVLSADPQARRPLFEEAAGIHKFRVKKREALRKLELTEGNLVRVRDIVREVERQLGPLERAAEIATRYNDAKSRLESLERNFLIAEVRTVEAQLAAARADRDKALKQSTDFAANARAAEERAAALAHTLGEADHRLDGLRARHQAALTHAERVRGERALSAQRAQSVAVQIEALQAEIGDTDLRLEVVKSEREESGAGIKEADAAIHDAQARINLLDNQRKAILPKIASLRQAEENRRIRVAERERAKIGREAELAQLQARLLQFDEQEQELARRVEALDTALEHVGADQAARKSDHDVAVAKLKEAETALLSADQEVHAARETLNEARKNVSMLQSDLASLWSRLQTLQELEASQEGYYSGVRAILQASQRGRIGGEYKVVADAFTAPQGYDVAFDVALGGSLQDIIVATEAEAKAGIDLLKRERAGRATFLPLNRIRPGGPRPQVQQGMDGYLGCAADLAAYDQRYAPIMEMLLGRALVCKTINDAIAVADRARGWGKVVTLTGEVLTPNGAMSGGSASKAQGSLLHRKTEIAALIERTQNGRFELAEQEGEETTAQDSLRASIALQQQAQSARQAAQAALAATDRAQHESGRDQAREEQARKEANSRLELLRVQRGQAANALEDKQRHHASAPDHAGSETVQSEADATDAALLPSLIEQEQGLQEELLQSRIALASAQEKARGQAQAARANTGEMERLNHQRDRRADRLAALLAEANTLGENHGDLETRETEATIDLTALKLDLDAQGDQRRRIATESREAQIRAHAVAEERAQALAAAQAAELKEARLQMQQSQSAQRLLDEYDCTVADALAQPATPEVAADTPREVARLRRELRAFGEVNTGAAAEYAELKERYDSTSAQQRDAETAKDKVLAAIREIDDSTRGLFMDSFNKVGVEFEKIFQRLMGGGHTELSLTDPDNLLETGVEIAVQAPGKKKQNLMLLSGGERALTATALLFAFLKVKPAPFCVMDEVDAPLDGVNVERFASLLSDFGKQGQFLVITHNPSTMEAARCWYGVTMQEPGVSRVLSMEAPAIAEGGVSTSRATMEPMKAVVATAA